MPRQISSRCGKDRNTPSSLSFLLLLHTCMVFKNQHSLLLSARSSEIQYMIIKTWESNSKPNNLPDYESLKSRLATSSLPPAFTINFFIVSSSLSVVQGIIIHILRSALMAGKIYFIKHFVLFSNLINNTWLKFFPLT